MNIGVAILGLALLVFIHEAGHFFVARAVGMRPRRFYVGFPPAIAKVRRNGIEYGLGAIPLGGYVKIPGMHRPAPSDLDAHMRRPLEEAPQLAGPIERVKRTLGAGDFDGVAADVDALERCLASKPLTPAAAKAGTRGVRDLRDALGRDAYWRQSTWRKVAVILAGPAANIAAAIVLLVALFVAGVPTGAERFVEEVVPGTPAAQIGIHPGDEIFALNGRSVTAADIPRVIRASEGEPITVTVVRQGGSLATLPAARPVRMDGAYRLGFALAPRYERFGPLAATRLAAEETVRVTEAIGVALYDVVSGRDRNAVATPVGVVQGSSQALDVGLRHYLQILALISLSLALLNLLPLLPLDGGHIAFSLLEGVRGRAVGRAAYERASVVGIMFVLFLFAVGLSNDITRLRGG
ncbi:MAG: site-2 protease family protein [Thermoleophilia bacterium]|nr:site-2 protease family protein [Thermoleophilia bacterium]